MFVLTLKHWHRVHSGIRLSNLGVVTKQTICRQMEVMFLDPAHFLKVCSLKKKPVVCQQNCEIVI